MAALRSCQILGSHPADRTRLCVANAFPCCRQSSQIFREFQHRVVIWRDCVSPSTTAAVRQNTCCHCTGTFGRQ
ncbi:hypothetical protein ACKS0A_01442 [Histoplasma ohiense]